MFDFASIHIEKASSNKTAKKLGANNHCRVTNSKFLANNNQNRFADLWRHKAFFPKLSESYTYADNFHSEFKLSNTPKQIEKSAMILSHSSILFHSH